MTPNEVTALTQYAGVTFLMLGLFGWRAVCIGIGVTLLLNSWGC